jgi:hypothetical protein
MGTATVATAAAATKQDIHGIMPQHTAQQQVMKTPCGLSPAAAQHSLPTNVPPTATCSAAAPTAPAACCCHCSCDCCYCNVRPAEECDAIVDAAEPRLQHSSVVAAAKSDAAPNAAHKTVTELNKIRTSDGMFFVREESPLIAGVCAEQAGSNALPRSMLAAAAAAAGIATNMAVPRSLIVRANARPCCCLDKDGRGDCGSSSCRV